MTDPRFYTVAGPFTLGELAKITGADIAEGVNSDARYSDVAPLSEAGPDDISFLDNKKYVNDFTKTKAGAVIVHPDLASKAPDGLALLLSQEPYRGYARIANAFYPVREVQTA